MIDLEQYLDASRVRQWAWGEFDCLMFAAGWVWRRCGVDPAAEWRGTYSDEAGCIAAVERGGGMLALMTKGLATIGRRGAAVAGAVGLVAAPVADGRLGMVGAICIDGRAWAVLSRDLGLIIARPPGVRALAAWTF